jgi:hypothetical protein
LTEYSDLLEVEAEEMETAAVMVKTVKMAEATETAVAVMTMAATVKTATTAEVTETAAAVMTMAEKAAADIDNLNTTQSLE